MIPPLVMTCGEPAGVGPELAGKAWEHCGPDLPFAWIGDPRHLPPGTPICEISSLEETATASQSGLPVLPHPFPQGVTPGMLNPANAQTVIDVIARGVELVMDGRGGALVTAPIQKSILQEGAAFAYPGHTEFLAALGGNAPAVMMLASPVLRVVPVTIHIPLADVPQALTPALLEQTLRITDAALKRDFGIAAPRLAVAGLNPHAGENGRMGHEEQSVITPVLARLRAEGMTIIGPLSADTMFHPAARAGYDVAITMYHDQGLIPIKTLDFDRGVNITLGLPFIRTSPDHGTALDIAGQGIANPTSTIAALMQARTLADTRIKP